MGSRWVLPWLACVCTVQAVDFDIKQVSDERYLGREPTIGDAGLVAWCIFTRSEQNERSADICVYSNGDTRIITASKPSIYQYNYRPLADGNMLLWNAAYADFGGDDPNWTLAEVPETNDTEFAAQLTNNAQVAAADSSAPTNTPHLKQRGRGEYSGEIEICLWRGGVDFERVTRDSRDDINVGFNGSVIAWQRAKAWPFGWEIMMWKEGVQVQLTTNYYYDMAPKVHNGQITWYGWDGHDFEIFLYDTATGGVRQITNNQYDDVSPVIWNGEIAWEAYPGVDAEIFLWKDERIRKISDNIEDDLNPRIWDGKVVWQGFDGDDFEIYYFDGVKTIKLTSNTYDDMNPEIRDNVICWMGYYDNWDSEIFVWTDNRAHQLTDNDYDDRDPKTAGGRIAWQAEPPEKSLIFLAEPKQP